MPRALLGLLGCLLLAFESAAAPLHSPPSSHESAFPEPAALRAQVEFWTRVYVEISSDVGFLHDNRFLSVVYETLPVDPAKSRASRKRQVDARKRHWAEILQHLAQGGEPTKADADQALQSWRDALGHEPSRNDLRAAASRLRFQRGQRDRFEAGLVRAGAYEKQMREIFREHGLPQDLVYLPHVESSFNTLAYSKVGAAGMWQFMRSTGQRYLNVGYVVDERLDPILATRAAAKLLRHNYAALGTWPLALTAYNHGAAGMKRALKTVGTTDIAVIIARYQGPTFRMASRNFYAQFLAARRIARDPERHFAALRKATPETFDVVPLPFYVDAAHLERHLGVSRDVLAALNPSLRPAVLRSDKYIPTGFALRLPRGTVGRDPAAWLGGIPAEHRHDAQRPSRWHLVRRGETLGHIARRYATTVSALTSLNGLDDRHRIYQGQKLELLAKPGQPVATATRRSDATRVAATVSAAPRVAPATTLPARPRGRGLEDGWTTVDHDETLAHYAEWLDVSTSTLRRLNGLSKRHPPRMGQRLKLDFSKVSSAVFVKRRATHHEQVEARFFARHALTGTVMHTLKPGENLWVLSRKVYGLPPWLLHRFNPDAVHKRLAPGARITIPILDSTTRT